MNLNWFESLIYGFVSGITEFLPISSQAHQALLLHLFGAQAADPMRDLLVHIATFLALYLSSRGVFEQIKRERKLLRRNRQAYYRSDSSADIRLVKNAAVALVIGAIILTYIFKHNDRLPLIAVFLLINGIILYIPERMIHGNKDARTMSAFDSLLIGLGGALSAFPGISRIGFTYSIAVARGADRRKALNWVLFLSFPAIVTFGIMDLFSVIFQSPGIELAANVGGYIMSFSTAFLGAYLGIALVKRVMARIGFSGFAYYSWGAALFTFILYLVIV